MFRRLLFRQRQKQIDFFGNKSEEKFHIKVTYRLTIKKKQRNIYSKIKNKQTKPNLIKIDL